MDSLGLVAIILCCGLFAEGMLTRHKLKALQDQVAKLEKRCGTKNS